MAHKRRIGSETDSPEQAGAQKRHSAFVKISGKLFISVKQELHLRMNIALPIRNDHGNRQLYAPRNERCQSRTAYPHRRNPESPINKYRIQHNIDADSRGTDRCRCLRVLADLHNDQIALRNSGQQIRKARDPKIADSMLDQHTFIGKNQHQIFSGEHAGRKKYH